LIFRGDNTAAQASRRAILFALLVGSLKLLHPFMPFITEEIYADIPLPDKKLLMIEKWPVTQA
ncbi:MAG: class I tRNA ligase family protein, partial [Patescibacteria group bacterium]